jgi:PAS domain S-box-containing protein
LDDFLIPFIGNLVLVVMVAGLGWVTALLLPAGWRPLTWGLLFGVAAVLAMQSKIYVEPGRFVDFRIVPLVLGGFAGGPAAALVEAAVCGGYRLAIGGDGTAGGVVTAFVFAYAGCWLRSRHADMAAWTPRFWRGLIYGLPALALAIIPVVPPWQMSSLAVVTKIAAPYMVLAPIALLAGFQLFFLINERMAGLAVTETANEQARVMDMARDYIMMCGLDGTITYWNHGAERGYGWSGEEARGRKAEALLKTEFPAPLAAIREKLVAAGYWEGELTVRRKDGGRMTVKSHWTLRRDADGRPAGVVDIAHDITAEKKMADELARLDRLNLAGEMAASIGHEVRNPLTTVRGYLQLFQKKDKFGEYRSQLATMIGELDRANGIITEYLSLAKNKAANLRRGDLNEGLTAMLPLLQADALQMGRAVELRMQPVPPVAFDGNELRQLVMNLVRNGLEAAPAGGTVTVATYEDADGVVLAVRDTGNGIPAAVAGKLGTPFVTTKDNGTGLGLPVCYRIAHRHGARMEFVSGAEGTTFFVRFGMDRRAAAGE